MQRVGGNLSLLPSIRWKRVTYISTVSNWRWLLPFPVTSRVLEWSVAPVPWQRPRPGAGGRGASGRVTVRRGRVSQTGVWRTKWNSDWYEHRGL